MDRLMEEECCGLSGCTDTLLVHVDTSTRVSTVHDFSHTGHALACKAESFTSARRAPSETAQIRRMQRFLSMSPYCFHTASRGAARGVSGCFAARVDVCDRVTSTVWNTDMANPPTAHPKRVYLTRRLQSWQVLKSTALALAVYAKSLS